MRSPIVLACLIVLLVLLLACLAGCRPAVVAAAAAAGAVVCLAAGAFPSRSGPPKMGGRGGRRRGPKRRFHTPIVLSAPAGLFEQIRAHRGTETGEEVLKRARRFFNRDGRGFRAGVYLLMEGPLRDAATLEKMREAWLAHSGGTPPTKCQERGEERVAEIPDFDAMRAVRDAARADPTFRYLDVGSAEGCITAALGASLGLPKERVVACDVQPQPPSPAFEFVLTDGRTLPFADGEFGLVTMFMSAHHFEDAPRVFAEALRVARPGAYLLLREHGRADEAARLFYDLVHAFYETAYRTEKTPAQWGDEYAGGHRPTYRTADEWAVLAAEAGFTLVEKSEPRQDNFDTVYVILTKPDKKGA